MQLFNNRTINVWNMGLHHYLVIQSISLDFYMKQIQWKINGWYVHKDFNHFMVFFINISDLLDVLSKRLWLRLN
jgi:hypothetical protein